MSLLRIATRDPVTASPTATVAEVARLMEERQVGSVVVVRDGKPVGIVTDRDLVLRVLRKHLEPDQTAVRQVMSSPLECVAVDRDPAAAAVHMRQCGVRRLPILDPQGALVGIVTYDDLVSHLGVKSGELTEAISRFPRPLERV